ncbi:MAG: CAP domain-containing protein [Phycisphaerae bacterium]
MRGTCSQFGSALWISLLCVLAGCSVNETGLLGSKTVADETVDSVADGGGKGVARDTAKRRDDVELLADQLMRLINIERFDIGAVELDVALAAIATRYACKMIDDDYFGHIDPATGQGLVERMRAAHYDYSSVGENLAAGIARASDILDAWLLSEPHREVMLDPDFTRAGIGVRHGGEYGTYCVLLLAEPAEGDGGEKGFSHQHVLIHQP